VSHEERIAKVKGDFGHLERKESMKQCFIYSQSEACQNLQEKLFFFSVTESYNKHYEVKDI
jgi:hypothetical protein